jgi:excinuclease ABC subunit C
MECKFYVYRLKNTKDEVIYIGKTTDIKKRICQHINCGGHINKKEFVSCGEIKKIEYITFKTKKDADMYEAYFINKSKPVLNINRVYKTDNYYTRNKLKNINNYCNIKTYKSSWRTYENNKFSKEIL